MLSAPQLITPNVCSFTELTVGKECRRKPLFVIITVAFKVTNRPLGSCKVRSREGSHLQGGEDRTGDPILTSEVFHTMQVTLSLKLVDHKGLALFVHVWLLKMTLIFVLPVILIQIPIRELLSPAHVCCQDQSGTAWCCLVAAGGTPVSGTQLWETQCQFCIFCIISLVINIVSIITVISRAVLIFNL